MVQLTQNLIGQSPAWLVTLDAISGLAAIDKPILVVGEAGTGKTSVAGRMHFLSPRWEQTWQAVNCAALNEASLEARLFGGVNYGQAGQATSLLESADGGTLFLDNIECMSLCLQEKLCGVIETGAFLPSGTDEEISVDVRFLSASLVDLRIWAAAGRFSENLLSLLAYDVITLPPLRARKRDIIPLAEKFATKMVADLEEDSFPGFSAEVIEFMESYDWQGNIRELKAVVERAVGRAWNEDGGLAQPVSRINIDPFEAPWTLRGGRRPPVGGHAPLNSNVDLQAAQPSAAPDMSPTTAPIMAAPIMDSAGASLTERTDAFELAILKEALTHTKNHQGNAAKYLGLTYHQFRGLLRKHGLKK